MSEDLQRRHVRSFTGVRRERKTRRVVKIMDRLSRTLITTGGVATILAVLFICFFLVYVVVPLFEGGSLEESRTLPVDVAGSREHVLLAGTDEYRVFTWLLLEDGDIEVYRLDSGERILRRTLYPGKKLTAAALAEGSGDAVFGFADGSVALGRIRFHPKLFEPDQVPKGFPKPARGEIRDYRGGVVQRTPQHQIRWQRPEITLEKPASFGLTEAILRLDLTMKPRGPVFAAITAGGSVVLEEVNKRENWMTGETTVEFKGGRLALSEPVESGPPRYLLLSALGTHLYVAWEDGYLVRYNVSDLANPVRAEGVRLLRDRDGGARPDLRVTAMRFLIGKTTVLVGDSSGRVRAWFPARPKDAGTVDGVVLVNGHEMEGPSSAVVGFAPSRRSRLVAVSHADGRVRLLYVTTEDLVASCTTEGAGAPRAAAITPKEDGLILVAGRRILSFALDAAYPEVTLSSLFRPVWYEGYERPVHKWQSTGDTDDYEPKFGLMPLISGTLKAAFYSLLFGFPIAILAAIFTSEFLRPRVKAKIKPTIELMAGLPSVVLGFLAALVFAPFVEHVVTTVLTAFLLIPVSFLLGAHLWQLLPREWAGRLRRYRFAAICLTLFLGLGIAVAAGPVMATRLFGGDIKVWLSSRAGPGWPGWFLLLLPVCGLLVALLFSRVLGLSSWLRRKTAPLGRAACARIDLAKFAVLLLATVLLAFGVAHLLQAVGLDPRGTVVDTYVQRNALIVGFVMGFAIIPIIYTISEDALSAVPVHLRSASLGAGATPWQTAVRIVVPTAMSGLFSAAMIGLGRAVGETMIVLMAAGNTPILDWNVFSGFRTLSANLATELPEAVVNSAHYRTLFLAALVLFLMTFVVNTVAEVVRLRFRRRAFEL